MILLSLTSSSYDIKKRLEAGKKIKQNLSELDLKIVPQFFDVIKQLLPKKIFEILVVSKNKNIPHIKAIEESLRQAQKFKKLFSIK